MTLNHICLHESGLRSYHFLFRIEHLTRNKMLIRNHVNLRLTSLKTYVTKLTGMTRQLLFMPEYLIKFQMLQVTQDACSPIFQARLFPAHKKTSDLWEVGHDAGISAIFNMLFFDLYKLTLYCTIHGSNFYP